MMKSVGAVLQGILLALLIGLLLIFGIVVPTLTNLFGSGSTSTVFPWTILVFAAAFAFYWGGMRAAYKAPNRRRVHGVLVGVLAFTISPLVNLTASALSAGSEDPFANLRTSGALLFTGVLFVAVLVASYVGARRGEALYAYNRRFADRQKTRQRSQRDT